jgi:hypothetical protein
MQAERTVQERAQELGLSMAKLSREARVRYWRICQYADLTGDEQLQIEAVLDRYKHRRRSAAVLDAYLTSRRPSQAS